MNEQVQPPGPTAAQLAAYEQDGALVMRGVIGEQWLTSLAAAIERDIESPGPFFHGYDAPDGGQFHGNTRWHNDQPYWPIRGRQVISFWVALDKTTLDSGALEFVPGSHNWDRWFQPETFGITEAIDAYERNPDYEDIPDIEADRSSYPIVSWDLEPGDVYVFHAMTVHGSPGNIRGDRRRRGYAVRYVGDDVIYDDRPGISKPLLNADLVNGGRLDSDQYPLIDPLVKSCKA